MIRFKFAAFILPLAILAAGCANTAPESETETERARAVRVATVEMRPLELGISASGVLAAREEALVGSELAGYRVAQLYADEGDYVTKGQVLARLDPALLEAEIGRARAQVVQSEAANAKAQSEARRVAGLDGQGVLAQESIEQRRFDARSAQANVSIARAQLQEQVTRRERLVLRAPVAGTIMQRNIAPGAISSAGGDPLFRIARGSLIELAAEVSEADLSRIAPRSVATVTLADDKILQGSVRLISPRVQGENQLGIVRVALPVDRSLRAGGTATARFTGITRMVPSVPETAVQFSSAGASVMVVGRDNRARRVAIKAGQRSGGFVELLQGPETGSQVLLSGAAFVLEGDIVRPVRTKQKQAAAPAAAAAAR